MTASGAEARTAKRRCLAGRAVLALVLTGLVPSEGSAQATSPSGNSMTFQPVVIGGGLAGANIARPATPVRKRKFEPETEKIEATIEKATPQLPKAVSAATAPLVSPAAIDDKLHNLDRLAKRGMISLEDYRTHRDAILRGE